RLALAAVAANRSGDPRGDGVALGRRALVREGAPAAEAAVAEGCAVSAAGSDADPDADPKGAGALALLLLALLALRRRPTIAALLALVGVALFSPRVARADEVAAGLYVRADTDDITVVSPKLRANVRLGDRTTVGAGYAADIWTGASIDVRTAATRPIREQRDELTAHLAHELDDVTLGASYRFSHEGDYDSHGGALDATWRFAEGNATVRARLLAAQDVVGRAGDPDFERRLGTLGAHLVYTQNVDRLTLLQLAYELTRREGYQASPYRFVGIGGDGSCAGTAQLCVAEAHPGLRMRNAAVARFRRAFGERFSFGAAYRFYGDDWGLFGHTITAQLGVLPGERDLVTLRARFHGQDAASFYRARYEERPGERLRYVTRDRELGALFTTRVQLAWERTLDLTDAGPELQLTLAAAGTHLRYRDFVGLDQVWAVELTFAAVVLL
ncbi:MAG TPA: DUF3570 domain-containing protein, partial [Polyangiaceae bacterium LLY-WYZ-15_(1-7)]|nr:DUF3570 domain-containing protein [Polyangiaceae bacterium LLY-WYZ-15_(1-7)]